MGIPLRESGASELSDAMKHKLLTGEMAPAGIRGRVEVFRLRPGDLEPVWRRHRTALLREWRREYGPDVEPWAELQFGEDD